MTSPRCRSHRRSCDQRSPSTSPTSGSSMTTSTTPASPTRFDPTTADDARDVLEVMWTIRRFEEALEDLYSRGMLHGTNHLSIGQEAVAVGACSALQEGDLITSTH